MKNPQEVKAFGVHLRRLREAKDLSQQELADLSDLNKRTVQRIENGQTCTTNDLMVSLARALEIEPKELMSFSVKDKKR